MKKVKGLTNRIVAMLMSGMLVVGAVPGTVLASENQADIGQTSEIAAEVPKGANTEEVSAEAYSEDAVTQEVEAEAQYYTVTLDANGGYFENEWDDALDETVEQAEVVEKHIPVGGNIEAVPVFTETDQDGQLIQNMVFAGWSLERDGELVSQAGEEYIPVDNCVLYAVWYEDDTSESGNTSEEESDGTDNQDMGFVEEGSDQADTARAVEENDASEETKSEMDDAETVEETAGTEEPQVEADEVSKDNEVTEENEINQDSDKSQVAEETRLDYTMESENAETTETAQEKENDPEQGYVEEDVAADSYTSTETEIALHSGENVNEKKKGASIDSVNELEPEWTGGSSNIELGSAISIPTDGNRYTVLLFDTSGSMSDNLAAAKVAAIKFCEQILDVGEIDYISIVPYASYIKCAYDFTNDIDVLKNQINSLRIDGGTNINAALEQAAELLNYAPEQSKKNVVLFSDGLPQSGEQLVNGRYSRADHSYYMYANQVYSTAKSFDKDWNIYTIGFFQGLSNEDRNFGMKLMEDITNKRFYNVTDIDDLVDEFELIAKDVTKAPWDRWKFVNSKYNFGGGKYYYNDSDWEWLEENVTPTDLVRIIENFTGKAKWTGACWGMGAWCALVSFGYNKPEEVDGENELYSYKSNKTVQSAINKYHALQKTDYWCHVREQFMSKDQNTQIEELEEYLSIDNHKTIFPVLISMAMAEYYDCYNKKWYDEETTGHAVVGKNIYQGKYTDNVNEMMQKIGRGDAIDPSWVFSEKISLYDPNYPDTYETDIYISKNTDNYIWCYPLYGLVSTNNIWSRDPGRSGPLPQNNVCFKMCCDGSLLSDIVEHADSYNYQRTSFHMDTDVQDFLLTTINHLGDEIESFKFSKGREESNSSFKYFSSSDISDSGEYSPKTIILPIVEKYHVETESDPMDFMLSGDNTVTTIQADLSGKADFSQVGGTVSADGSTNLRISMTSNDYFKGTSWNTITAVCTDAKKLSLYPSEEGGAIVSGDLTNLTIKINEDNNIEEENELLVPTDQDSVLIKEENDELVPYVDNDGDGSYESILPISIENGCITGLKDTVYTGDNTCSDFDILVNGKRLSTLTDCDVYVDDLFAGTGKVTVYGKGRYTGVLTATFRILPQPINDATVKGITNNVYVNEKIEPSIDLFKNGNQISDSEYDVKFTNNINAGTAKVIIKGKGNYTGRIEKTFKIEPFDISKVDFEYSPFSRVSSSLSLSRDTYTYTGNQCKPKPSIYIILKTPSSYYGKVWPFFYNLSGKTTNLKEGKDYVVSYTNNIKRGTATVKITGKGNYKGTVTESFIINPASIAKASVGNLKSKIYTGKALTQVPVVKVGSRKLKKGTDYSVSYRANKNVGKATIIITGKGNYKGVIKKAFNINPKSTSILKINRSTRAFKVFWKKQASQVTGYQIQYSTDKAFKSGNKAVTVTGASTVYKVIGSLTKGKTYYVRIRTYKTVGSAKYWSVWSSARSVKISK